MLLAYLCYMELTFNQLKEREVINIIDGKSLGRIIDITLSFPEGKLVGITVPGKRQSCFSRVFERCKLYIDRCDIKKIGGDVILVSLNCGNTFSDNSQYGKESHQFPDPCHDKCFNNKCPPPCPPQGKDCCSQKDDGDGFNRIDLSDY